MAKFTFQKTEYNGSPYKIYDGENKFWGFVVRVWRKPPGIMVKGFYTYVAELKGGERVSATSIRALRTKLKEMP
jgi:hypothetical protein